MSDAQLCALSEVEAAFLSPGGYTFEEGASQAGLRRRTLQPLLEAGHLRRTDTGDPDTDGGRYRLHLTPTGLEQLNRARARGLLPAAPALTPEEIPSS